MIGLGSSAGRGVGDLFLIVELGAVKARIETYREMWEHMNETPRFTVRRSAEGALLVREFCNDKLGWKLVASGSENCVFLGDGEIDPLWLEWPIIWCPDASVHEQDNIRRAHGRRP